MADIKKPDNLEMEKIKLERLKVYGKIITVLISVGLGTYGVTAVNSKLQEKQINQQGLVNEAKLQQSEMENLGKFLEHALKENINDRIRFAEYFAKVTIDEKSRGRWSKYLTDLVALRDKEKELKKELISFQKSGDYEKVKEKKIELSDIRVQTAPLATGGKFLTREEVMFNLLKKDFTPLVYTENKFEFQTIDDDKVILDLATGLTWEHSGSGESMEYNAAKMYVAKLNRDNFAGYNDWRLPTLAEAITLLEQEEKSNGLFIDPVFDKKQRYIWTSDKNSASRAWVVYFNGGGCGSDGVGHSNNCVRAVR